MGERPVLLGTSQSNVNKLAVAIANEVNNHGGAVIRSIGLPAGYQTLKAVTAAQAFDFFKEKFFYVQTRFENVIDRRDKSKTITSIRFECNVRER